jgi:hypothetical protein
MNFQAIKLRVFELSCLTPAPDHVIQKIKSERWNVIQVLPVSSWRLHTSNSSQLRALRNSVFTSSDSSSMSEDEYMSDICCQVEKKKVKPSHKWLRSIAFVKCGQNFGIRILVP